jgi:hypothetical protein
MGPGRHHCAPRVHHGLIRFALRAVPVPGSLTEPGRRPGDLRSGSVFLQLGGLLLSGRSGEDADADRLLDAGEDPGRDRGLVPLG